jgi:uridine kinase
VKPYVVALSSYTGGGKTTLARHLTSLLNATSLFWDEYDEAGFMTHPKDWRSWLAEGADNNAWKVPRLAEDLAKLKQGKTIMSPLDGSSLTPTKYIIYDAPLGYAHEETGKYIDFLVFVDTPLDVAMARRVLRDYFAGKETLTDEQAKTLKMDMESYLEFAREAYLNMDRTIKPFADLVLDGTLAVDVLVTRIVERIAISKDIRATG